MFRETGARVRVRRRAGAGQCGEGAGVGSCLLAGSPSTASSGRGGKGSAEEPSRVGNRPRDAPFSGKTNGARKGLESDKEIFLP